MAIQGRTKLALALAGSTALVAIGLYALTQPLPVARYVAALLLIGGVWLFWEELVRSELSLRHDERIDRRIARDKARRKAKSKPTAALPVVTVKNYVPPERHMVTEIRELHYREGGAPPTWHPSALYVETGGLPWYRETDESYDTKSDAFVAACRWAVAYRDADRMGNMASAHGVVQQPDGRWKGVINYFHSNT